MNAALHIIFFFSHIKNNIVASLSRKKQLQTALSQSLIYSSHMAITLQLPVNQESDHELKQLDNSNMK